MSDMSAVIIPKSDQWNADDFQAGPITFTIRAVRVRGGQEQPVEITVDGSNKFYRPCKSMARVMVSAWGADSSKYVGRSLTLYCDPKVKWGGMEVGGIRISHMSDIDSSITMALTVTRANKKPFTVKPLVTGAQKAAASQLAPKLETEVSEKGTEDAAAPTITDEEALVLEARCTDNSISPLALKKAAKVERFSQILAADLPRAHQWLDAVIAKRQAA